MRLRVGISCATITCAGAAMVTGASCVPDDSSLVGPTGTDASLSDAAQGEETGSLLPSQDAGVDSAPPTDSAAQPDAPSFDAGCSPRSGFQPSPYVPAAQPSFYCSGGAIQSELTTDCLDDASTYTTCAGFADSGLDAGMNANTPACLSCLVSPENSDAGYAAVVQGVVPVLNVAGCIQYSDQTDAGYTCAVAVQAAWACTEYACKTSCPVSDDPSRAAYVACTHLAATGVCSAYTQVAQSCIAAEEEAGPPSVVMDCFNAGSSGGAALTLLDYFCGT
jgi:hypothetical protein